jgi:hypothetical protein
MFQAASSVDAERYVSTRYKSPVSRLRYFLSILKMGMW